MDTGHPDRLATTLAHRLQLLAAAGIEPRSEWCSDEDAADTGNDARVDLQLKRYAVDRAIRERGTPEARAWLAGLTGKDLRAGTVQDGTARGLMARYEEAISLCAPPPDAHADNDATITGSETDHEPLGAVIEGKELRRRRDILVASGGTRIRFSRKQGILLVDRDRKIHEPNCLQFEDQEDVGCLDGFQPNPAARPRLFSAAFLKPTQLVQHEREDRLVLDGRLGRSAHGFPCRIVLVGRKDEPGIRMRVRIANRREDHRLRIRFAGLRDTAFVSHRGTPGLCQVQRGDKSFVAATLVRACGRLRVDNSSVPTPGAQVLGIVEHTFGLGLEV